MESAAMTENSASWIGGGVVAAIIVPVAASTCLGLAHVLGVPDGDLSDPPKR